MKLLWQVVLYFHTLRYLRPAQMWGRLVFLLSWPTPDLRPAPSIRRVSGVWQKSASRRPSMLTANRFCFLNEIHELSDAGDWLLPDYPKLWIYNLHYFDDLNAVGAEARSEWHYALIRRWVDENQPGAGTGWEPYPLSLRIINWVKWALAGNSLDAAAQHSLAIQVRFLSRKLEHHLLGNHLFANAKALVFAGCYFRGKEADRWLRCGMDILVREIPEQILSDGGHFERSTMYHALAYEDMLDLTNLVATYPEPFLLWKEKLVDWPALIERMGYWLTVMCHPDGEIAFFNDAAVGIAPYPQHLIDYAEGLGFSIEKEIRDGSVWLKESGYVRVQWDGAVLIVDVAPVGPDYLPGHAHADTLSFEFSLHGQRLIVNSGTSRYGLGPEREWERSTAAHNTVEIDHENSSEVWAGFRVARRAYPFEVTVNEADEVTTIEAAHDGYKRLAGRPVHRRSWQLRKNKLVIRDLVEGEYSSAIARYHFSPSASLRCKGSVGEVGCNDAVIHWNANARSVSTKGTCYAPEFGVQLENACLELEADNGQIELTLCWQ